MKSQEKWSRANIGLAGAWLARGEFVTTARLKQYPLDHQRPPIWLVTGGRGAGKTRLGAEWVNALVRGLPPFTSPAVRSGRIALVGETLADARDVMVEGPSGILVTARDHGVRFEPSRRRVVWVNGAVAQIFSSEDPESLRGPQFDAAWCDELAKWKHDEATFDMLQFCLRLGDNPRQIITTTPKPTRLMRRLHADPQVVKVTMPTDENAANLAPGFVEAVRRRYAGSRLGRQELDGELIEDRTDALWSRAMLEAAATGATTGMLHRIVVALDPPATATKSSDACGIVAAGLDSDGRAVVLADATVAGAKPQHWASVAIALYHRLAADCLVAEVNQGGDMVAAVIATVDRSVRVKTVRASRGKWLRAEPVAALYEQGRVHHAARFAELEDEMCDFGPDGLSNGRSPDRVDALVWAISELMPRQASEPRVRDFG